MQCKATPMRLRSSVAQVKRSPQECARSLELRILKEKAGQLKAKDFLKLRADLENCKVGSQFPKRASSELEGGMPAAICALQLLGTDRLIANTARGASASHAASSENMEWVWKALATPGKLIARINQFHSDVDNEYVSPKQLEGLRKYLATHHERATDHNLQIAVHLHQWLEAVLNYVDFRERHTGHAVSQSEEKKQKVVAEDVDAPEANDALPEAEKPAGVIAEATAELPAGAGTPDEVVAEDAEFAELEKAGSMQPATQSSLVGEAIVSPAAMTELQGSALVAEADTEEEILPEAEKAESAEVQHIPKANEAEGEDEKRSHFVAQANEAEAEDEKRSHFVAQVAEALPVSSVEKHGVAVASLAEFPEAKWVDDVDARSLEVLPTPSEGQELVGEAAWDTEGTPALQAAPNIWKLPVEDEEQHKVSGPSKACAEAHHEEKEFWPEAEKSNNDLEEATEALPVEAVKLNEDMEEDVLSAASEKASPMEAEISDFVDEVVAPAATNETPSDAVEDAAVAETEAQPGWTAENHGDHGVDHGEISEANEKTSSTGVKDDIAKANDAVHVETHSAEAFLPLPTEKLSGETMDTAEVASATEVAPDTQKAADGSFTDDKPPEQASGSGSLTMDMTAPAMMTGTLSKTVLEGAEAVQSNEGELEEEKLIANATGAWAAPMLSTEDRTNAESVVHAADTTKASLELEECAAIEPETAEATVATSAEEPSEVSSKDFGISQAESIWPNVEKHTEVIAEATGALSTCEEKPSDAATDDVELAEAEHSVPIPAAKTSDIPVESTEVSFSVEVTDAEAVETYAESEPELAVNKCSEMVLDHAEPTEATDAVLTNLQAGTVEVEESKAAAAHEPEEEYAKPPHAATHVPRLLLVSAVEHAGDTVARNSEITEAAFISSDDEDPDNMIFAFEEEANQTNGDCSHAQAHTAIEEMQKQIGYIEDDANNETTYTEMEDSERANSDLQNFVLGAIQEGYTYEHEQHVMNEDGAIETSLMDELTQSEHLDSEKLAIVHEPRASVNSNTHDHFDAWTADDTVGKTVAQDDMTVVFESPTPQYHESLSDKWNHAVAEADGQVAPDLETLDAGRDVDESMLNFPREFSHVSDDDLCISLGSQEAQVEETKPARASMEDVEFDDPNDTAVLDAVDETGKKIGKLVTEAEMLEHMQKQVAPNLARRCKKLGEDAAAGVDPSEALPEIAAHDSPKVCHSTPKRNNALAPMWTQYACVAVLGVNILWASLVSVGYLNM